MPSVCGAEAAVEKSMDTRPLIAQALGLHQRGQLDQAANLYGQVLKLEPRNFPALQLLGVLRGQQGHHAEAKKLLQAALEIQPQDFGALLNYGQVLMGDRQYRDALDIFDKAVAARPHVFEAQYNRAVALSDLQRHAEAIAGYDKALALNPNSTACLYNRGICLAVLGRREEALASYDRALALDPNFTLAMTNRANVLRELQRPAQALESYDRVLMLAPNDVRVLYNRGNALSDLRRFQEAVAAYDRALGIQPAFAEALSSRGVALLKLERFSEALDDFDKALGLSPGDPEMFNNRGVTLWHLKRALEARACYDQALALMPDHAATLLNRAFLFQEQGEFNAALADYDKAIVSEPGNARAWNGRGSVLHTLKRNKEALAHFDRAVALDPRSADALVNRAHLRWTDQGDYTGAASDLRAALAINPDHSYARGELLHLKMYGAEWDDFEPENAAIDQAVRQGQRVVRPFVYQALCESPADLKACSRIFASDLFPAPSGEPPRFAHAHDKIRIGYVSGEFREQATAYLMAGLYELHDREKFQIVAIDSGAGDASPMRARLEAAFDEIIPIAQLSDSEAANRIRAAEIDILVNLNGYFGTPRMGVFARRAAPIQVNYLGFPATLGAPYMDYILADRVVIPQEERCHYDEQVVYLPHSYQVNDRKRAIADDVPSRASLGLPPDAFVFCNFNQSYKITPDVFDRWMRILRSVEGSVLWLLHSAPPFQANLSRAARQHGVAPERLVFAASLRLDRHLARLKQADLFLDTLPYNAHTTASDALWVGLPLLTCRGTAFPGRVAASLLGAVGLPELITESLGDYEARAIALARDPGAMAELKEKLAGNRLVFPLFDTDLFRKNLEMAYTTIWRSWKGGNPPKGFAVECAAEVDLMPKQHQTP
jgi:predicted O-linked N-acetylglucosamine transferase (SPINDLY family)